MQTGLWPGCEKDEMGISLLAESTQMATNIFHRFKKKLGVGGSLKIKSSLPFTFLFAEFSYVISTHRPYLNLELVNDTKPKTPQGGKSLNLTNLIKNPLLFNNNQ